MRATNTIGGDGMRESSAGRVALVTGASSGQMTKCAALDYADRGIWANAICPGTTWTGLVKASALQPVPPPDAKLPAAIPMKRWGLASELAAAALLLACDESSYVTGTAIPVDGGVAG